MKKNINITSNLFLQAILPLAIMGLIIVSSVQAQDTKGKTIVASVTVTATVTKIDQKSREVTIKTDSGQVYSFVASSDVKNLAQVKKGDKITATYAESLAYQIRQHGGNSPGLETTDVAVVAQPGAKPAGAVAHQTTLTVTITAINHKTPSVTFKGPNGITKTIKVDDPTRLQGVKVGDVVDLAYTEAVAITVNEVPKK